MSGIPRGSIPSSRGWLAALVWRGQGWRLIFCKMLTKLSKYDCSETAVLRLVLCTRPKRCGNQSDLSWNSRTGSVMHAQGGEALDDPVFLKTTRLRMLPSNKQADKLVTHKARSDFRTGLEGETGLQGFFKQLLQVW